VGALVHGEVAYADGDTGVDGLGYVQDTHVGDRILSTVRLRSFVLAAVLALTACTGEVSNPDPTAAPTVTTSPSLGPECPVQPKRADEGWPKDVPDVVPRPPGLKVQKVDPRTQGNVTQVRADVPMSLRDSLLWIVREFPKNGFVLGRGDAEQTEVDAPFQRSEALRGLVRVFVTQEKCSTFWLYAVVQNTNAPYDIGYTPPPSSTPLPFG